MSFNNLDQLYRQVIMDHYRTPRNRGKLEDSNLTVDMNNPTCGDTVRVQLKIEDGYVKDAKFEGEGCSISLASASMMTQAIKGKKVTEALEMSKLFSNIDSEELDLGDIIALQGVSKFPARIKCATLAWKAMEKGVLDE